VTAPTPDILVVRYVVKVNESVEGRALNTSERPRITVFARGADGGEPGSKQWKLVRWGCWGGVGWCGVGWDGMGGQEGKAGG